MVLPVEKGGGERERIGPCSVGTFMVFFSVGESFINHFLKEEKG
jgi:hypothetical protein